eukprot:scaffold5362_cov65-Skeletonema_marinoi.AAC.2
MESPKARQTNEENGAQYKTKVKKTQDDFAEYLTGDKPPLDSFIERRRGKVDTLQASSQLEDTTSSSSDDSVDSSDKVIS